jgi:hypothetical protein
MEAGEVCFKGKSKAVFFNGTKMLCREVEWCATGCRIGLPNGEKTG